MGRINEKLTMIMGNINMKICFLFLAAVVTVGCAGMDNPQSAAILAQGFAHSADLYAAGARPVSTYQPPMPVVWPGQSVPVQVVNTPQMQPQMIPTQRW